MKKTILFLIIGSVLYIMGCEKERIADPRGVYTNDKNTYTPPTTPPDTTPNDTIVLPPPGDTIPNPPISLCDTNNISFSAQILPIFQQNCVSCHNPDYTGEDDEEEEEEDHKTNDNGEEPYLRNYLEIWMAIEDDPSDFFKMIRHRGGDDPMPPDYKMTDCEIRQIELWYNDGAKNN